MSSVLTTEQILRISGIGKEARMARKKASDYEPKSTCMCMLCRLGRGEIDKDGKELKMRWPDKKR